MTLGTIRIWASWTMAASLLLGGTNCAAGEVRPISSVYGICLAGFDELQIRVQGPSDVEFASLVHQGRVVAQFQTTLLGPAVAIPADQRDRWQAGTVVLVKSGNNYVGIKRYRSEAYPSVYVRLLTGAQLPGTLSRQALMQGLVSCTLSAPLDASSPPKIDASP